MDEARNDVEFQKINDTKLLMGIVIGRYMSVEQKIRDKLTSYLQVEILEVVNESPHHKVPEGAETHFRVLIVSKDFKDLNTVKRHQKVYKILKEELHGPIHAFSQRTFTPEEWKSMSSPISSSPPCQKKS